MHHADACCCTSLHYAWRGIDASHRAGAGIDALISISELVPFLIGLKASVSSLLSSSFIEFQTVDFENVSLSTFVEVIASMLKY